METAAEAAAFAYAVAETAGDIELAYSAAQELYSGTISIDDTALTFARRTGQQTRTSARTSRSNLTGSDDSFTRLSANTPQHRRRKQGARMGKRKASTAMVPYVKRTKTTLTPYPGYTRTVGAYARYGGRQKEKKWFDKALEFNVSTTGTVVPTGQLVEIPNGSNEDERDGKNITVHSIHLRGVLRANPGVIGNSSSVAVIYLIKDMQTNGSAAGATDVFTGTDFSVANINMSNSKRFRVLRRFVFVINPTATDGAATAIQSTIYELEYYSKINCEIAYSGTLGTLTEIRTNNLFLMAGLNTASQLGGGLLSFTGNSRVRFSD